ncbi:hypothetical protein B0H14DRAFT_2576187 [Mycena olivaceomarginata]|nr:hypothetical protein B0H14DRAFT_2576187 [Mycena olivaceomarginata]
MERDGSYGTRRTVAMGTVCSPTPELASILEVADHLRAFSQSGMSAGKVDKWQELKRTDSSVAWVHPRFGSSSAHPRVVSQGCFPQLPVFSPPKSLTFPSLSSSPSMVNSLFNLKTVQLALSAPSTGIPLLPGAVFQERPPLEIRPDCRKNGPIRPNKFG